jgi:uncharacterized protein (TIGR04222 family)
MNPFDLPGPTFLRLYLAVLGGAAAGCLIVRWLLRSPGGAVDVFSFEPNPYEAAYLSGGPVRALHAAVANLVQRGLLAVDINGKLTKSGTLSSRAWDLEREIFSAANRGAMPYLQDFEPSKIRSIEAIHDRLESLGLVISEGNSKIVRTVPLLMMLGVAVFGGIKILVGLTRGRPVGFLVVLCIAAVIVAIVFYFREPRRSRRGDRVWRQLRRENSALKSTAEHSEQPLTGADLALAFGLFGIGALGAGPAASLRSPLKSNFKSLYDPHGSSSGSSCSGSSCGGGGGCGGG